MRKRLPWERASPLQRARALRSQAATRQPTRGNRVPSLTLAVEASDTRRYPPVTWNPSREERPPQRVERGAARADRLRRNQGCPAHGDGGEARLA